MELDHHPYQLLAGRLGITLPAAQPGLTVSSLLQQCETGPDGPKNLYAFAGRPKPGRWHVPEDRWHELFFLLTQERRGAHHLVEVRTPISRLAVDIDIQGAVDLFVGKPSLATLTQQQVQRAFPSSAPALALVTTASGLKDGVQVSSFHWTWPEIEADDEEQRRFAEGLQTELARFYHDDDDPSQWFGKPWNKIIDPSIYHPNKGLRLMWCDKAEWRSNQLHVHGRPKLPYALMLGERRLPLPANTFERFVFTAATSIRRPGSSASPSLPGAKRPRPNEGAPPPAPLPVPASPLEAIRQHCLRLMRERPGNARAVLGRSQQSDLSAKRRWLYVPFTGEAKQCPYREVPHNSQHVYANVNLRTGQVLLKCHDEGSCKGLPGYVIGRIPEELLAKFEAAQ